MRRALTICILGLPALFAQSTVTGSRTVQGNWDASGASATKPAKAGATLPGTCFSGEFFFNTAAGSGQNLYLCNPNNTWAPISGGSVASVFGRSGAVLAATGDYTAAQVTNAVDATATYANPTWISALAWSKLTGVPSTFAPTAHNLLGSAHSDTSVATVTRGAVIIGQGASPTWAILGLGASSRYLRSNGTDLTYSSVAAGGAGACSAGQVMTAANDNAAPTCAAPAYSWLAGVPTFFYQNLQANSVNQTQRTNLNFSSQFALADSAVNNSTTVNLAATIGANTTGNASTATALVSPPTQCGANNFATGITAAGNANCSQPAISNLTGTASSAQIPANVRARAIGSTFSGGGVAMTVGLVNYFTVPFACTISAWNITVDTGTATIDVWKSATGTAIPTVTNTIAAAATPAISTGTALHSATLTGWTTAVNANDIFAFQLKAVSNATLASLVLECDQ
jgi:hypothetical protein